MGIFKGIEKLTLTPIEPTREPCEYCGSTQEGECWYYYEDLCPDRNPADAEKAKSRYEDDIYGGFYNW